jgi:hypothetical protein
MKFSKRHASLLLVLLLLPGLVMAGLRCGTQLALEGDTKSEVLAKCGNPVSLESIGVREVRGTYVSVEQWTYAQGAGRFLKILEFHGSKLVSIQSGGRL